MKICLVRLPSPFLIDDRAFPPLGLLTVGTALSQRGHDVMLFDGDLKDVPLDFPYYGLGPTTPEYSFAVWVKDRIRNHNPDARIIIGGPFATLMPEQCFSDGFDCVVRGDGEFVAEAAFSSMQRMIEAQEQSLDDYPIIDRSLIDHKKYKYLIEGRSATSMVTSRGCPYRCAFCCKNYTSVRLRSANHVMQEIGYLHWNYGYSALMFSDDLFILSKDRTETICKYLQSLEIVWRCLVRADFVVKYGADFVKMLSDSGCREVGMGIESGSDRILRIINKGEKIATIKQAIRMLQDQKIKIKGFMILGLPGENPESIQETDQFLSDVNLDDVDIKIFQPYPGSPIWRNPSDFDIGWDETAFADQFYKGRPGDYHGTVRTASMTNAAIVQAQLDLEQKYKRWS